MASVTRVSSFRDVDNESADCKLLYVSCEDDVQRAARVRRVSRRSFWICV